MLNIKIKKLYEDSRLPIKATEGAAGWDLYAHNINQVGDYVEIGTGVAMAIPAGWQGLVFARSSITNTPYILANSVGIIDSDYRGEIKLRFKPVVHSSYGIISPYVYGERCGQIGFFAVPESEFMECGGLGSTERLESGFGSTGKGCL